MTADTIGGIWTYALELARGLAPYGVEVVIATMGAPASAAQREEARRVPNVTLRESSFRLEWMKEPWEDVERSGEWLLALAAESGAGLVHLNGYVHADLPWGCPVVVVAHSCVLSWWEAVRRDSVPAELDEYRDRVARGVAGADLVAAPTAAMLAAIERLYLPPANRRVIHNARSDENLKPGRKEDFILSVGRVWDEAKNIASLARISRRLPWPVLVAGEETHPEGGTVAVDDIIRLGMLSSAELVPWFAAASIYALPARYEPFGLTVLEAARSGCALVLGDIPTLRELWDGAAVFVPPDDEKALAAELGALCRYPERRHLMAAKAVERSRAFSPEKMASGYIAAYRSLVPGFAGQQPSENLRLLKNSQIIAPAESPAEA